MLARQGYQHFFMTSYRPIFQLITFVYKSLNLFNEIGKQFCGKNSKSWLRSHQQQVENKARLEF